MTNRRKKKWSGIFTFIPNPAKAKNNNSHFFGILLGQVKSYNGNKHKSTLVGLSVNIAVMTVGYITANSENYLESFLT